MKKIWSEYRKSLATVCLRSCALVMVASFFLCAGMQAQQITEMPTPPTFAPYSHPATPPPENPKVGLVLEGGGALGLAHIGVLKWLEEHHIPVSYIAGTSMGGLVSGVYATGHNPAETLALIKGINWDEVLAGQTPFEDLSFRRKEDAVQFPTGLEFGLRKGVHLPEGFNSGQQVNFILDRVALPYSEIKDFNQLPTPFACVATNIVTGTPHVFRNGPLSTALRSTMSLPGIFAPVRVGDAIYADGALTNNFPVNVAFEMGANYTIGVFLATQPVDPKQDVSVLGVAGQSISLMIAANETEHKKMANILVNVDLYQFTSMDYNKADEIVEQGYKAAEANKADLIKLAVDDQTWNAYISNRQARRVTTVPTPQFVDVQGTSKMLEVQMEKNLHDNVGRPVDIPQLQTDITKIVGAGRYSSLSYSMTEKNNQQGLLISAVEKSYAPPIVRPLIVVNGAQYNNVLFSAGARITFLDFGAYGAELRNDIIVGSIYEFSSEYYRPLKPTSKWFVAPRFLFNSNTFNVYNDQTLIAQYRQRVLGGNVDGGYAINPSSELRFGYASAYERYTAEIGSVPDFPVISGRMGNTHLKYTLDDTNDAILPTRGLTTQFRGEWWDSNPGATEQFPLSQILIRYFKPVRHDSSVFLSASGGTTFGRRDTGVPSFSLGGPIYLAAYGQNQYLTNQYYYFQGGLIHELAKLPPLLGSSINFVTYYEIAKPFYLVNPKTDSLPMDGVVAIVLKTILGPMEVGGAIGPQGGKVFFQLSRVF
jgi:NTE family protein